MTDTRITERAADDSEPHVICTRECPNGEAVTADAVNGSITRMIGAYMSRDLTPAGDRLAALANYELSLLLGQLNAADREVARLRARVRVDASDIERTSVTWAHVHAWLAASSHWSRIDDGTHANGPVWRREKVGVIAEIIDIVHAVDMVACGDRRPGLDILDEMAAMVVAPQPTE